MPDEEEDHRAGCGLGRKMRNRQVLGIGQLGLRLALAFVAVAVAAIAVNAAVSARSLDTDIQNVAHKQENSLAKAAALTAGSAYEGIGWARVDLTGVFYLARRGGAAVQVRDDAGRVIGSSPRYAAFPAAHERSEFVRVHGRQVGTVTVRFGPTGLGALARDFEARRWRSRLIAAGIATAIALVVSLAVARAISGPLEQLLEAVRARGAGGREIRVARMRGIGVVRELLESFNRMSNALYEQERIQRNLVADVAHELRTPVAVLRASHEAIRDGITEPTPENLESLREEVLRLARMVDDLQRLAAAEAAALQLTLAPHDVAAIAGQAAGNMGDSFDAAGVTLVRRLSEVHARCDADRIRDVVSNLLMNALKFTAPGGTVVLDAGPCEDGRKARIRVSDTGIGITADELPHVTERFFRGGRSSGMAPGSGIGLTIVTELVHAHGGQLEIASVPGKGTKVTVLLPSVSPAESRRVALLRSHAGQPW